MSLYLQNPGKYPAITEFVNGDGTLEIGYTYELGVALFAYDEGGTVWEGKDAYPSLEAALDDAEQNLGRWIAENW